MDFSSINPAIVSWVIIPGLIFFARICDVTIGTLRIVFISRGNRTMAPFLGFFEVLIWLIAIGQVMKHLDNAACYIGWAAGFATGNYVGLWLEERLAMGQVVVRFITGKPADELVMQLRHLGYRVTQVEAKGRAGKVDLLFMVIKRKSLSHILGIITQFNPKAFYSVEDVRTVAQHGLFDQPGSPGPLGKLFSAKKGK